MQRVATHVVFQQVAQVLGRDVQVSGPLQTRLGPHAIHLVFSDTLCVGGGGGGRRGARRRMDIIHSFPELQYNNVYPIYALQISAFVHCSTSLICSGVQRL